MTDKSFASGTSDEPLRYQTIGGALDLAADSWPDSTAIVVRHQDAHLTWSELRDRSETIAANLMSLGMCPGDRIGIWSPNCLEWILTQFASAKAGLILVNINPAYRLNELEYALTKVGCKALVLAERFKDSDYVGLLSTIAPELADTRDGMLTAESLPDLKRVFVISEKAYPGLTQFSSLENEPRCRPCERLFEVALGLDPDDPINIQFTSGTTGTPKGATLSHFNIINNARFGGAAMQIGVGDRICIPVPLYHCFGMVMGVLACVVHGSTMVLPSEVFDPNKTVGAIGTEKCTAVYGVPTMFIAMLECDSFKGANFETLRTGIMAGAPCPRDVMERVATDMKADQMTIAYGMTETSPVSFQSSIDDPLDKRVATVGRVHPHVQVKIIGEDGTVVPRGEQGELCTRGYSVMLGYWNDKDRTDESVDDNRWMKTGDLATMDSDGYVNITGRLKDMVIRGGENLYPKEIEEFLRTIDEIQDVQVVGVPDSKYGEELCAWVVVRPKATITPEEIQEYCDGCIARHKVPRYVRLVDEFPMTVTGKVRKFKIREEMINILGLAESETA